MRDFDLPGDLDEICPVRFTDGVHRLGPLLPRFRTTANGKPARGESVFVSVDSTYEGPAGPLLSAGLGTVSILARKSQVVEIGWNGMPSGLPLFPLFPVTEAVPTYPRGPVFFMRLGQRQCPAN